MKQTIRTMVYTFAVVTPLATLFALSNTLPMGDAIAGGILTGLCALPAVPVFMVIRWAFSAKQS